jgi:hypothetical protein
MSADTALTPKLLVTPLRSETERPSARKWPDSLHRPVLEDLTRPRCAIPPHRLRALLRVGVASRNPLTWSCDPTSARWGGSQAS